jgi:hypothetical protein
MITTGISSDGVIHDILGFRKDIEVFCRCCENPLVPVQGNLRCHHFRHKKDTSTCVSVSKKMSDWHLNFQLEFKPEYREIPFRNEQGKITNRADIYIKNLGLVIEFQHSPIKMEEIEKRKKVYGNLVWILDGNIEGEYFPSWFSNFENEDFVVNVGGYFYIQGNENKKIDKRMFYASLGVKEYLLKPEEGGFWGELKELLNDRVFNKDKEDFKRWEDDLKNNKSWKGTITKCFKCSANVYQDKEFFKAKCMKCWRNSKGI